MARWQDIKRQKFGPPKDFKLFLDDVRNPSDVYEDGGSWILCRTIEEAKLWLKMKGVVTHLSLDGDMGQMEDDKGVMRDIPGGVELLDWLRETHNWPTKAIIVHSQNPVKRRVMQDIIDNHYVSEDDLKEYTVDDK